jgi:Calcium-activated chloride channel
MGLSASILRQRRFITFILTILILGICFGSVLGLKFVQKSQRESNDKKILNGEKVNTTFNRVISLFISFIIVVINNMLSVTLRKLTGYELHDTLTNLNRSLILKITIAQFVNTCLLVVAVHWILIKPTHYVWAKGNKYKLFNHLVNLNRCDFE